MGQGSRDPGGASEQHLGQPCLRTLLFSGLQASKSLHCQSRLLGTGQMHPGTVLGRRVRLTSDHGAWVKAAVLLTPIGRDPGPLRQEACGGRPHVDDLGGHGWRALGCGYASGHPRPAPGRAPRRSPPPAAAAPGSRCGAGSRARLPPPRGICEARVLCMRGEASAPSPDLYLPPGPQKLEVCGAAV